MLKDILMKLVNIKSFLFLENYTNTFRTCHAIYNAYNTVCLCLVTIFFRFVLLLAL